jgi:hypothetical protein
MWGVVQVHRCPVERCCSDRPNYAAMPHGKSCYILQPLHVKAATSPSHCSACLPITGIYGTRDMVAQYAAQLVVTVRSFQSADPRVGLFSRLLMPPLLAAESGRSSGAVVWAATALPVLLDGG